MSDTKATLLDAATSGDADAIASLVSQGAAIDTRDERGQTPLLIATHANNVEAARLLIEAGADVNAKDAIQDSAISTPAREGISRSFA